MPDTVHRIGAKRSRSVRPLLALRLAAKGLRRDSGTTTLAVAILALGLAAPSIFFSFLVGATRDLPVPGGDRVVRVDVIQPSASGRRLPVTGEDLADWRRAGSLEDVGGFRVFQGIVVDVDRTTFRVSAAALTPDVLPLLRVSAVVGRLPLPSEAGSTLLLGYDAWTDAYASDPGVVGRVVELEGRSLTVVGILPQGFGFPFKQNAWVLSGPAGSDTASFDVVARLADGSGRARARAELGGRWAARDGLRAPGARGGVVRVEPYTRGRGEGGEAVAFLGLTLVAVCLLLIACSNVANLILVRATERVRVLGIQSALGAGRAQVALQLFLEALLVSAVAGAVGLLLTSGALEVIQTTLAAEHFGYFWMRMAVDGTVILFTATLVLGTAVVAGTLPIVRMLRIDVLNVLKGGGAAGVAGGGRWSRAFVTAQLALSCAALVAAGLTGRALAGWRHFGGNVPSREILTASAALGASSSDVVSALEQRIMALPGAGAASVALGAPGYFEPFDRMELEGVPGGEGTAARRVLWNAVTPGFFAVVGVQARAGRLLNDGDDGTSARVAVVNEAFVRRFAGNSDPLGRRLRIEGTDSGAWFTVVGVVSDADVGGGPLARRDRVYVPLPQVDASNVLLLVRAPGYPTRLAQLLRRAVQDVDPSIAVDRVATLAEGHAFMTRVPRAMGTMAVAGGSVGLLVAMVGFYGLLAFRVRQRRRELGVLLALGADGSMLARAVMGWAIRQMVPALVVGLGIAWLVAPMLAVMLLGMNPRDPATYAGVALSFLLAGLAAAALPALRAAAVDPARVLRGE